ncbi:MAG: hypothetical protein ASARMPRED_009328 [Alectoria sarmentosa]|nr:MAG: hypothetical protein ASARMPRED_009328 [Alectoria sarmentosa]
MSAAPPDEGLYGMGLEGLRTYDQHDVDRDGPFHHCNVYAEPLALYRSGGYHPIHLGDTMQEGRYIILHKLGWGLEETIWLARDRKLSRDVAIKFFISDRNKEGDEESILRRLADGPVEHPGKAHVIELLDQFEIEGPNGHHQCLVTEALGPRILRGLCPPGPLSPGDSWEMARQLVEATVYMHSMKIVHGDICGHNVLVTSSDLLRREACPPIKSYGICEVETVDGSALTAQAPRYQVEPAITKCIDGDLGVKVIDFGKRYVHGIHYGVSFPFNYKAPEIIFGSHFSQSADIWSLGCTIFEIITTRTLYEDRYKRKDDIVDDWINTFGDLPEEWKNHTPSEKSDAGPPEYWGIRNILQRTIDTLRPGDMWFTKPSLDTFGDLIISMMQYRPSDRPSASDVLQHPWSKKISG